MDEFDMSLSKPTEELVKELGILSKQAQLQLMSLTIRGIEENKEQLNDANISLNLYIMTMNFCASILQNTIQNWQDLLKRHQEEKGEKIG